MTKRLFDHADTATLEEQLELEAQLQVGGGADRGLPRGRRGVPREAHAEVHRPLTQAARTRSCRAPRRLGGSALPASCARAAAAVTAGSRVARAASPRSCSAFATRRSAASQARTAWLVARRRLQRSSLSQRGLVERQRLRDVGDDLVVRARPHDRLASAAGEGRADRVGALDEVAVREAAAAAAGRERRKRSALQQRQHFAWLREPVHLLLREHEVAVREDVELARASRLDRRVEPCLSVRPRDSRPGGRSRFRRGNTGSRRSSAPER